MAKAYVLKVQSPDKPGLVATVSTALFESGGNITEAQQFNDSISGHFFMRMAFDLIEAPGAYEGLRERLERAAGSYALEWQLHEAQVAARAVILVSKQDHCLRDLLYRAWMGDLRLDVKAIISNHPRGGYLSLSDSIPFHYLPVTPATKIEQEAEIRMIVDETRPDLVILARYMQVLSDDLSEYLKGRCINIHHSFLPGFKGAKPYRQAYERGVKVIGATAHYVTTDLDEGPIIAQDVEPITHVETPEELARKGRDIERRVLSRAVKWHTEHRVFVFQQRTVVFS
jgi:formyltetrahydrofolate deformylase